MKTLWVLPLLFISIAVATVLHANKSNGNYLEDDIDGLAAGLKDINNYLPEHTNFSFAQYGMDNYLYCRYLLAPRHCSIDPKEKIDTVLSICKIDANDSILHVILDGRKKLMSNKDQKYQYFLTSNR